MSDSDDRNDKTAIIELINDPVIADPDAPGLPAFEFFTSRRTGIVPQFHHFIFDTGGNRIG
jgi:hypothetical protein